MFKASAVSLTKTHQEEAEKGFPLELKFDEDWYLSRYPAVSVSIRNGIYPDAYTHFVQYGCTINLQPSPYFSTQWVKHQFLIEGITVADDCRHDYLNHQPHLAISAHWLFNERLYRAKFQATADAVEKEAMISGYIDFVRWADQLQTRPSVLFSSNYFCRHNEAKSTSKPFNDFLRSNWSVDVKTSVLFDPEYYLQQNPKVLKELRLDSDCNTLIQHFVTTGVFENRCFLPDFDIEFYDAKYRDDIENSGCLSATQHFLDFGVYQNAQPNPYFDPEYYIQRQPEVIEESRIKGFSGVFEHFLEIGSKRNYVARQPLISLHVDEQEGKTLFDKRARVVAQNIFLTGKKLVFPHHDEVDVSCVIPVFNKADYTYALLRQLSLIANDTSGLNIEVIVVDNGSTDQVVELNSWSTNLVLLRNDTPLGYTKACNLGAAKARGRNILFMNNDIELLPDAITVACDVVDQAGVGAVGGRILLPNGTLQEAGSTVWRDGTTRGHARGESPLDPSVLFQRDVDYCSGCFLMVSAQAFELCNGYAEEYSPGYYEDADLCARIWRNDMRVVFDPRIAITHFEYASFSNGRPPTVSHSIIERHRDIFVDRNKAFLATQQAPNNHTKQRQGDGPKHVFIMDDLLPDPKFGSGFTRAYAILDSFLKLGWRVTVWAMHERGTEIDQQLSDMGVLVLSPLRCSESLTAYFDRHCDDIDVFWCARTHNFQIVRDFIAKVSGKSGRPQFVADSEAVDALRKIAYNETLGIDQSADADKLINLEFEPATEFDSIVAVSWLDKISVEGTLNRKVDLLGMLTTSIGQGESYESRKDILFCGAVHELESPNLDSLFWYINEVHPIVVKEMPEVRLRIVGYWSPSLSMPPLLTQTPNVNYLGAASEHALNKELDKARVFIAPTRYAGGVAQKVHTAMASGLPVVASPLIREQLYRPDNGFQAPVLAPEYLDPVGFAALVIELYRDQALWDSMQQLGFDYLNNHCSSDRFAELLKGVVNDDY